MLLAECFWKTSYVAGFDVVVVDEVVVEVIECVGVISVVVEAVVDSGSRTFSASGVGGMFGNVVVVENGVVSEEVE